MDAITVPEPAPFDGLGSVPNNMRFACHFIIDVRVRPGYIDDRGQLSECWWTCCDHFMVANHNGLDLLKARIVVVLFRITSNTNKVFKIRDFTSLN